MAKSIIQSRTPKSSTTTKSNTTHTTPKKTGATDDPQARAYERKKAEEDYAKSISSYSEKAIQDMTKNRINAMNEGCSKELAQITENADKERKAVEEGIDKLVEARKNVTKLFGLIPARVVRLICGNRAKPMKSIRMRF